MAVIRLAIDPMLAATHGPEVDWTWRTLLTGIGYAWQQVAPGEPCDIAYVRDPASAAAALAIRANPDAWAHAADLRLAGGSRADGLVCLRFAGEPVVRDLVTRSDGRLVCDRDLILDAFWLATGQGEAHMPRVAHGFFDLEQSPLVTDGLLREAVASSIGRALERWLCDAGHPPPLSRWPAGRRLAVCAGHDVDYPDAVPGLEPLRQLVQRGPAALAPAWDLLVGRRHHWHFQSWVDLEAGLGLRSAFYFCAAPGSLVRRARGTPDPFYDIRTPRFRDLFRALRDQGVEVGLHASYRACERPDAIAGEKAALEEAAGAVVDGNRHHYWRLHPHDPDATLRLHALAGLTYDASLAHDRYLGWRRGFSWPFFPFDRAARQPLATLQLPTAWMDDQVFRLSRFNGGGADQQLEALALRVADHGGCLMVDVHEYVFDDTLYPGWAATYRTLLTRLAARSDVWFARPIDVARHWISRAASIAAASHGLDGRTRPAPGAGTGGMVNP